MHLWDRIHSFIDQAARNVLKNSSPGMTSTDSADLLPEEPSRGCKRTRQNQSNASFASNPSAESHDEPQFAPRKENRTLSNTARIEKDVHVLPENTKKLEADLKSQQVEVKRLRREKRGLATETTQLKRERDGFRNDLLAKTQECESKCQEVSIRRAELDRQTRELSNLTRAYEQLEKGKSESDAALAEIRQFVAIQDCGDGNLLAQRIDDFNTKVDDFAFNLSDGLSQPLTRPRLYDLVQFLPPHLRVAAIQALEACQTQLLTPTSDDVLMVFAKSVIHLAINSHVWSRFCPSLDSQAESVLTSLYRHLQVAQPQALHSRWRSLTYESVLATVQSGRQSVKLAEEIYHEFVPFSTAIRDVSSAPLQPGTAGDHLVALEDIVNEAFELHKLIGQGYLSSNYEIYVARPSSDFNPDAMHQDIKYVEPHPRATEYVLGSVSIGLLKRRLGDDGKGGIVDTFETVRKAGVVTTRWLQEEEKQVERRQLAV